MRDVNFYVPKETRTGRVHVSAGNPHIERRRVTSAQGEVRVPERLEI